MITSVSMHEQVQAYLTENAAENDFDITAMVDELKTKYGLVDIETIPDGDFNEIMEKHEISWYYMGGR